MYISQNRDKIGFNKSFLFFNTIKKRVEWLNNSIHLRKADWASIVNLSALINTIILIISPQLCIFVLAKNFKSSRINRIPLPNPQFTYIT